MNKKIILVILIILGVVAVSGCIGNEETSLFLNSTNVTINANETNYTIMGSTDINATVHLSSSELNLSNVTINVDSKGVFKYNVIIPQNVTDVNIVVSSIATGKLENHASVHIQRPIPSLHLNDVNFTDNDTYITVSGTTDPNAKITISSSDLDVENISVTANNNGIFKYQLYIPKDKNNFNIKVESQILGKKVGVDTLSIVRILTPEPEPAPEPTPPPKTEPKDESNSSSLSPDKSDDSTQVIITSTGKKYHTYQHGNMKYISYVSLSEAVPQLFFSKNH